MSDIDSCANRVLNVTFECGLIGASDLIRYTDNFRNLEVTVPEFLKR